MRDRVLDSDTEWRLPEEAGDAARDTSAHTEHVADGAGGSDSRAGADETTASSGTGGPSSGLFGGFGVGTDRFDDATLGGEPFGVPDPPHHWSVPWSDLMMVMFVMFAVIATAQLDESQAQSTEAAERVVERDRDVQPFGEPMMTINVLQRAQRVVKESDADDVDIVLMEDQSVKVSVRGPMLFALGSVELRPDVTQFLDDLAAVIRSTPYRIEVIGHTDDRPVATAQFPSNWELSTARASRVARYLIESGRLAPGRFTVLGRSEYDPVAPNLSEDHRASNRRVEILITRDVLPSSEVAIQ